MASTSATIYKSITAGGVSFNLSFTASFSTTSGMTVAVACLQSSYGAEFYNYDSSSWSASNGASGTYKLGTLSRGGSKTLFTSSTSFSSGSVSVTFEFYGSNYTFTISANLGSDSIGGTLSVNTTTVSLDDAVYFTVSGGSGVSYQINLLIGSNTISTGLTSSGSFKFTSNDFIKYFGQTSSGVSVQAILNSYSSTSGSFVSSSSVNMYLQVGNYTKAFTETRRTYIYINAVDNNLVAGTSSIKFATTLTKKLANDQATITSMSAVGTYSNGYSGTSSFTTTIATSGNTATITSALNGLFPIPSNSTSTQYQLNYTVTYTDSRGNTYTSAFTTNFIVLCYIPPELSSVEVVRCDDSSSLVSGGTYCKATLVAKQSSNYTLNDVYVTVDNDTTQYALTTSDNITFSAVFGGSFVKNTQYKVIFHYRTSAMKSYNSNLWLTVNNILPTMQLPISLFDDTDQVAVSFGEMAQRYSDVASDSVANFAKGLTLRATSSGGEVITKDAYDLLSLSGGGAKIYVQTSTTIPSGMEEGDILVVYNQ